MSQESKDKIESYKSVTAFNFTTHAAFGVLKESFTRSFWAPIFSLFKQSKKHFILPAVLLLAGPCIIMAGFYFGSLGLSETIVGLGPIIQYLVCFSIGSLGGIIAIAWSISEWLFKLTAFSRALELEQTMSESIEYLQTRKGFLFIAWFVYAILMTPFIFFLIASSILSLMQLPIIPQPLAIPDYIKLTVDLISTSGLFFTTMYASLLIAVSGTHGGRGTSASIVALMGTFKTFFPLLVYTILACVVFSVTLELVLTVVSIRMSVQNYIPGLWEQVAIIFSSSILRGIASFFILPFLIAVPAEITKRAIND